MCGTMGKIYEDIFAVVDVRGPNKHNAAIFIIFRMLQSCTGALMCASHVLQLQSAQYCAHIIMKVNFKRLPAQYLRCT